MKNIQKNHQRKTNTRKKITQDWQEETEKIQYLEKDKKIKKKILGSILHRYLEKDKKDKKDTKDQYYTQDWQEVDRGGKRAAVLDSWRERALTLKVIANYFQ